jgi:PleD family two-component response regulator
MEGVATIGENGYQCMRTEMNIQRKREREREKQQLLPLLPLTSISTGFNLGRKTKRSLILLAEDSAIQARIIEKLLTRYNFEVEVSANGESALERYQQDPTKYAIILMVRNTEKSRERGMKYICDYSTICFHCRTFICLD